MFVTFEGIDGSGKTSILEALCLELKAQGVNFCKTREPGGSSLGQVLRKLVLGKNYPCEIPMDIRAELFLFLADRAQHVAEVIKPALNRGEIVLCDRFIDSTLAYQGFARGLNLEELISLNYSACAGLMPDLTFWLDVRVEEALARVNKRNQENLSVLEESRFDAEKVLFHQKVALGYLELSKRFDRFERIDASQDFNAVLASCKQKLLAKLASFGGINGSN